jgi:hypothetical protein
LVSAPRTLRDVCLYRHLSTEIRVIGILFKSGGCCVTVRFLSFNWAIMEASGRGSRRREVSIPSLCDVSRSGFTSIDGNEFYLLDSRFLILKPLRRRAEWFDNSRSLRTLINAPSRNKLIITRFKFLIGLNSKILFTAFALDELHFNYEFRASNVRDQ